MKAEGGFTLLEVIIALAIAVLGIAAVAKATGGAATVAGETRERMLAVWVAGSRLSELRITRAWPAPGGRDEVRTMGGRTWYLSQRVTGTGDEDIRRVDIEVYTDERRTNREYQAFGYVARYRPPEAPGQEDAENSGAQGQDGGGDAGGAQDSGQEEGAPLPGEDAAPETGPQPEPGSPDGNAS